MRDDEVILAIYGTMRDRDLERFRTLVHDDIIVRQPAFLPYGGTYTGVDAMLAMFGEVLKLVDVANLELFSITADAGHVWAEFTVRARATGTLVPVAEHWTVSNGTARSLDVWFFEPALLTAPGT